MKKLISACRVIQTVSAVVAAIAVIIMASAYEPSIKAFLIMGVIFLVSIIIAAIMALIIDIATEYKTKQEMKCYEEEDDGLPEVEAKEIVQEKSCRAFYNYKHDSKGFYINERR